MPKVSIIMPTYNVEKYFRKCLESVVNQTLEDIEIIPVDDGSPDNCGKIMDEYALKDHRIKPIHKENGGYGSAVNIGIEKATGEYISILETDDFAEKNAYELLYNCAKKNDADVVKCGFYNYNSFRAIKSSKDNSKLILDAPEFTFNIKEYPEFITYHSSVWAATYKKEFIKDIKFIEEGYYQDFPFNIEVLSKAKKIAILKEHLIHYRVEQGQGSSVMIKDKKLLQFPINVNIAKEILKKYDLLEYLKEYFYYHSFWGCYDFYKKIDIKYKLEYIKLMKVIFEDLKYDKNFNYTYFSKNEKKIVDDFINKSLLYFYLSIYYKRLKLFFIEKQEVEIYEVIKIFRIITIKTKPIRLEIRYLKEEISYLKEINKELNCKLDSLIEKLKG